MRRNRPAESNVQEPLKETASQTAGPYVHIGCLPNAAGLSGLYANDLVSYSDASGALAGRQSICISGCVFDGDGAPCKDVMLEFWQANHAGDWSKGIWQRAATNLETGEYSLTTAHPTACKTPEGKILTPFIYVWIVARGINIGLTTRVYFPEDNALLENDPHVMSIAPERVQTLIAEPTEKVSEYRFDIHLQGAHETVFFDV